MFYTIYFDAGGSITRYDLDRSLAHAQTLADETGEHVYVYFGDIYNAAKGLFRVPPTPPKGTQMEFEF